MVSGRYPDHYGGEIEASSRSFPRKCWSNLSTPMVYMYSNIPQPTVSAPLISPHVLSTAGDICLESGGSSWLLRPIYVRANSFWAQLIGTSVFSCEPTITRKQIISCPHDLQVQRYCWPRCTVSSRSPSLQNDGWGVWWVRQGAKSSQRSCYSKTVLRSVDPATIVEQMIETSWFQDEKHRI